MNTINTQIDKDTLARESFSGRILTNHQYGKADLYTDIIKSEIHYSGRFKDPLGDLSYAFARTEKFDVSRAENTLREIFKLKHGQSMNEMRTELMNREDQLQLDETLFKQVVQKTQEIEPMIREGDKITFNRAYTEKAGELAFNLGITNAGARRLMTDAYREQNDGELYDWGKGLEEQYYRPQIEAEAKERKANRSNTQSNGYGNGNGYSGATRSNTRRFATGPRR